MSSSCLSQHLSIQPEQAASSNHTRPYLKYAGCKFNLINEILKHIPEEASRLIEPFAGSCAVGLNLYDLFEEVFMADLNQDLVITHNQAINNKSFKERARSIFAESNNKESYYKLREEFNNSKDEARRAELFLYLNRHSFNGLCRYSKKGNFNAPYGHNKTPYFPSKELDFFASKMANATIICNDFRDVMNEAKKGDFIYCDPPYAPLTNTANFSAYTAAGFSAADHHDLAKTAEIAANNGATVVISNHDTAFTREIYKTATAIESLMVTRTISCNGSTRKKAEELMAIFLPK